MSLHRLILSMLCASVLTGCAAAVIGSAGAVAGSKINEASRNIHTPPHANPAPQRPIGLRPSVFDEANWKLNPIPNPSLDNALKKLRDPCEQPIELSLDKGYSPHNVKKISSFEKPSYQLKNESSCEPIKLPKH